jgi:hypothetical protein
MDEDWCSNWLSPPYRGVRILIAAITLMIPSSPKPFG